jgi:hypothetical protein
MARRLVLDTSLGGDMDEPAAALSGTQPGDVISVRFGQDHGFSDHRALEIRPLHCPPM